MMKRLVLVMGLLAFVACGSDVEGGDDGPADGPCVDDGSLCATMHLPDDFVGEPRQIIVGLYDSLPPTGPPIDVPAIVEGPSIEIGTPLDIEARDMMTSGSYFVYIALYVEGGGNFVPEPGVDYVWETTGKVSVGSSAVNFGDVEVALAP